MLSCGSSRRDSSQHQRGDYPLIIIMEGWGKAAADAAAGSSITLNEPEIMADGGVNRGNAFVAFVVVDNN